MAIEKTNKVQRPAGKYRRVEVATLDRGRRGKHHELIQGIFEELKGAQAGTALEIPLADIGGIGLANLRSAVHRGASAAGLAIETVADDTNFYVWKTSETNAG